MDFRDGKTYRSIVINNQMWMADNLAYLPYVSPASNKSYTQPYYYVYGYQGEDVSAAKATDNYAVYGVLYNIPAALNACPSGWHLPSDPEWTILENYLGGTIIEIGGKLKETGTVHWWTPNTGATNESAFTALPGGTNYEDRDFEYMGRFGSFWTSTESSSSNSWSRTVTYDNDNVRGNSNNIHGFSVRCVYDFPVEKNPPVITPPDQIVIPNEPGNCHAVFNLNTPVVEDESEIISLTNNAPDIFPIGITVVKWKAIDVFGNETTADQIVVVNDTESPTILLPEDIVQLNDPGECQAIVDLGNPIVSDNCGIAGLTNDAPDEFDVGTTIVTWRAADNSGNITLSYQKVTVTNNVPAVGLISAVIDPVQINTVINTSADYTDNNVAEAIWSWGDGISSPGLINDEIQGEHSYLVPGVYTLKLLVADVCGETAEQSYQYIVSYNPEGGFVTGGGWIESPPGASTCYPDATGKANFGFVAKYKKGISIPDGNTEFQFRAGNLDFKSTVYDWLVIASAKAMFKGEGTINQEGLYGFMLSAIDEDLKASGDNDRFRIKIWDKFNNDQVVYDNEIGTDETGEPNTQLAGGSIVIHNLKLKSSLDLAEYNETAIQEIFFDVFPNPFNNKTFINLNLPTDEKIILELYDLKGSKVKDLYNGIIQKGINYKIEFTPDMGMNNGVYLLILNTSEKAFIKRIVFKK